MMHNGRSRKLPFDAEEALEHLRSRDKKLAALIEQAGAFSLQLEKRRSPFASLVESIIYQQLHGKAASSIHGRVLELFGGDPEAGLLLDVPEERLRGCGVSAAKIRALRDLAAKTLDGTVPTASAISKMSDEQIVERLTTVRGVGPWTVEMLLIFRLGRPDVLPVSDYGIRKGFALTFGRVPKSRPFEATDLATAEQIRKRAKRWHPYASVASWYLWRACDLEKKKKAGS